MSLIIRTYQKQPSKHTDTPNRRRFEEGPSSTFFKMTQRSTPSFFLGGGLAIEPPRVESPALASPTATEAAGPAS